MQNIPAFKLLLFLLLGLSTGLVVHIGEVVSISILAISFVLILISVFTSIGKQFHPIYFVIVGFVLIQNVEFDRLVYPNKTTPEFDAEVKGKIIKIISKKTKSSRYLIEGRLSSAVIRQNRDIILLQTIYDQGHKELNLDVGDRIQAAVKIKVPSKPHFSDSFDERTYAQSMGFHFYSSAYAANVGIIERAGGFTASINSIRNSLNQKISFLFNDDNAGIIKALLTGDKSSISRETRQDFLISGTSHVLAVSGLHVGIISSVILLFISLFRIRIVRFLLFVLLLLTFIVLTGMQPSTIRAGTMAILIYFAWINQRNINLLNILSSAVICILLFEPTLIFSVGFQMSVTALLGISLLLPKMMNFLTILFGALTGIKSYIYTSISLTISVSIIVSPIVAYYFNYFSIISPIANLFIVPLITMSMFFSLLSIVLSYISIPFAFVYAGATDAVLDSMRWINSITASLPFSSIESETVLLISILVSICLLYIIFSNSRRMLAFRVVFAACVIMISQFLFAKSFNPDIEILPSSNMVTVIVPGVDEQLNIILDRKPKIRPRLDYSLFVHFKESSNKEVFLINGNCGIMLTEELSKSKAIKIRYISLNELTAISGLLGINYKIFQTI